MTNETNLELTKDLFFKDNMLVGWMEINYESECKFEDDYFINVVYEPVKGIIFIDGKTTNEILNEDRLNRLKQILE